MSDQATEQSYDTVDDAANALMDVLDPMDSDEQPETEDAGEQDVDVDLEDDIQDEVDDDSDDTDADEDEVDPDEDEESDEDSDEDEDDAEDEPEAYELGDDDLVTVDGQQITFKDLKEGQLRQADYTRKTQELATQRQQVEQWAQQQGQAIEQQSQRLMAMGQMLEQQVLADENIPWQQLAQDDPSAYIQMKEQASQRRDLLNQLVHMQGQTQQEQQQKVMQEHKQYLEQQRQELLKNPSFQHWNDPEKAATHKQKIIGYLQDAGVPEIHIKNLADASIMSIVDKAMKFDDLQAKRPRTTKKVKKAPQMVKPKARQTKNAQRRDKVSAQRKRLQQTGSVQDAAGLLMLRD